MYILNLAEITNYQLSRLYNLIQIVLVYIWSTIIFPIILLFIAKPLVYLSGFEAPCDYQLCIYNLFYTILGIQHTIVKDAELIDKGFIIANHRCMIDAMIDSYIAKASPLGRRMAHIVSLGHYLLRVIDNRNLMMIRGKETRHDIFHKLLKHMNGPTSEYTTRILFYPEGTRQKYKTLKSADELKSYLKYGLLKEIYLNKEFPVQIIISNNKEFLFSEYELRCYFGTIVNTRISKPIYPRKFATEQDFYDEIANVWFECYQTTHK